MFRNRTVWRLVEPFFTAYQAQRDAMEDGLLNDEDTITLKVPVGAIRAIWRAFSLRPWEIEP